MPIFPEFRRFWQTPFGKNLLPVTSTLISIAAITTTLVQVINDAKETTRKSNGNEANGRAVEEALGFRSTALYDSIGDTYVTWGTGLRLVVPNGPFDRADLKPDDHILLHPRTVNGVLIQQRGKTVVLPVVRAGRRGEATVTVPHFNVPHPDLVPAAPPSDPTAPGP